MKPVSRWSLIGLSCSLAAQACSGQRVTTVSGNTAADHVAIATRAAGEEYRAVLDLCAPLEPPSTEPVAESSLVPPPVPPRADWYVPPVRVFDNLYFVGEREYSAWAITTSNGIILVDTLWPYSVHDEIVDGLRTVGLDPAAIKYAIVTHAHIDHAGGAKYLQDELGVPILMSAPEWETLAHDRGRWPKPAPDRVVADGERLTLGDTTVTIYVTPGHTPGTLSLLVPVRDGGHPHLAAEWGGTGFNFTLSQDKPQSYWLGIYSRSAERFRAIAVDAGADVLISNHTSFDGSTRKLGDLSRRRPGDAHPYVVGVASVSNFLTVVDECAQAALHH